MNAHPKSEAGFSLIETMVAMGIISVLSALSLTAFSSYQADAYNSQALTQLRAVVSGEESYFSKADSYISCENSDCAAILEGVSRTNGVIVRANGTDESFSVAACSTRGNLQYSWDSINSLLITSHIEPGTVCDPEPAPLD